MAAFDEITAFAWDPRAGRGSLRAVRRNHPDDWFYGCHFLGDPVMPGCWGVDAVWQGLAHFAERIGLRGRMKPLTMEDVRFFGQIRPHDREIVYDLTVTGVERSDDDVLITGRAEVSVDGVPVYSIGGAQVGTAYWEAPKASPPPPRPFFEAPASGPLSYRDFQRRDRFGPLEIIAISLGKLVEDAPVELGLLPAAPMLQIGQVEKIWADRAAGEGGVQASLANGPRDWFYPMSPSGKPAALSIDGIWQLMGLFLCWHGSPGTGRALGFERVELFDDITSRDARIDYDVQIVKTARAPDGDGSVRANADVFADGRLIARCANASVGCHQGIRYTDYPFVSEMSSGGKVKARTRRSTK